MSECICGGTGLVTRLTSTGNTGPEVCDCVAENARREERERVKEALLSKESLTAIFGGEYGEEEVEPLREILTTLDKETD